MAKFRRTGKAKALAEGRLIKAWGRADQTEYFRLSALEGQTEGGKTRWVDLIVNRDEAAEIINFLAVHLLGAHGKKPAEVLRILADKMEE